MPLALSPAKPVNDLTLFADYRYLWIYFLTYPLRLPVEVSPVRYPRVAQQAIAFTFCRRKYLGHLVLGYDLYSPGFNHKQRLPMPISGHVSSPG